MKGAVLAKVVHKLAELAEASLVAPSLYGPRTVDLASSKRKRDAHDKREPNTDGQDKYVQIIYRKVSRTFAAST